MLNKILMILICGFILMIGLTACTFGAEGPKDGQLSIVASNTILKDVAQNIAGDRAFVTSIVPIGSDPHDYEPRSRDVQQASDADLIVYNGINLEDEWFYKMLDTIGISADQSSVIMASLGADVLTLPTSDDPDPHIWLDVRNVMVYADNIYQALILLDPDHADEYEIRYQSYIAALESLHEEIIERIQGIPERNRLLVTSEAAFRYFSVAYDIETAYVWEINAEEEGTPQQIRQLVDLLAARNIPVLFIETSVDDRSMNAVSRDSGIPIGAEVYTDSLGAETSDATNYIEMMRYNARTIAEGLTP